MTKSKGRPICPLCHHYLQPGRRRASYDHILPRVRGGKDVLYGDVRNTRTVCQTCNRWLSDCGYCIGALMCVTAVAGWRRGEVRRVYKQWKMGSIAGRLMRPAYRDNPGTITEADLKGLPPELIEQLSRPVRQLAERMRVLR